MLIEVPLKYLCDESSDIVVARVVSMKSYYGDLEKTRIFTDIQLEVKDNITGRFQKEDQLKLTRCGGRVDGITTIVVGAPQFVIGEESVFFLSEKESAHSGRNFTIVGGAQGKFNIFRDPATKEEKVLREKIIDFPLQLEKDGPRLSLTAKQAITMTDLAKHIRTYVHLKKERPE